MSLKTRTSPLPQVSRPQMRSRIPSHASDNRVRTA